MGQSTKRVRLPEDLQTVNGLVLPGGESTTIAHLLHTFSMWEPMMARAAEVPFWGVCAGSILLAKKLSGNLGPAQKSLGVMDISVERNGYGRQLESFVDQVQLDNVEAVTATFIRAPRFTHWGESVHVKGTVGQEPVFLEEGKHMVTSFHPELGESNFFHRRFIEKCRQPLCSDVIIANGDPTLLLRFGTANENDHQSEQETGLEKCPNVQCISKAKRTMNESVR